MPVKGRARRRDLRQTRNTVAPRRGGRRSQRQSLDRIESLVGWAIVLAGIAYDIALMVHSVEHEALAGKHLEPVEQLDGLLALNTGDHRGRGRRGRNLAKFHILA